MTTTITKNWISNDNKLFKARVKKVHQWVNGVAEEVEFEQIKKDGKWINLEERGKYIKTKTLYLTRVNHKSCIKKDFKIGKRYQVLMYGGLGQFAGYIYDEDGNARQLYRSEDVGFFTLCGTYYFEAQYL